MALGEQLSANQNIDLAVMNLPAHLVPGIFFSRGVTIDAENVRRREDARERAFDPLRTLPEGCQCGIPALRAAHRNCFLVSAMMTAHEPAFKVNDKFY